MNKKLYVIPLLLLFACLPLAAAQTYLYHATVTESDSGNLTGSIAIDGTVYFRMDLAISGLDLDGNNFTSLTVGEGTDAIRIDLYQTGVQIFDIWIPQVLDGTENILILIVLPANITVWVNEIQIYNEFRGFIPDAPLTTYSVSLIGVTGSFEAWVSLTDPTATPTATPASTPWVHNTAIPIGGNIGGLNTIILLLLLGGVGLSVTLLIVSKLKSNIIEAIIIMMILGTAGIVALLWLIGGFA